MGLGDLIEDVADAAGWVVGAAGGAALIESGAAPAGLAAGGLGVASVASAFGAGYAIGDAVNDELNEATDGEFTRVGGDVLPYFMGPVAALDASQDPALSEAHLRGGYGANPVGELVNDIFEGSNPVEEVMDIFD